MLVLSSPSGAGKTTLARRLLDAEPGIEISISHTTRANAKARRTGRDYHFVDRDSFTQMRDRGEFLEWAVVFDNYYGTPRKQVEQALAEGRDVLFDVDWQGAASLRDKAKDDVVTVFILPPTAADLEQRLNVRAQDPPETVRRRMLGASNEIRHWDEYDYVVVNYDIERSVADGARHPRRRASAPLEADRPQGFRAESAGPALAFAPKRIGDADEIRDAKLLRARLGIEPKRLQQRLAIRRDLAERGAQHLAPLAEGGRGNLFQVQGSQGGSGASLGTNSTSAESTFGLGVKAAAGKVKRMRGRVRHCDSTASRP